MAKSQFTICGWATLLLRDVSPDKPSICRWHPQRWTIYSGMSGKLPGVGRNALPGAEHIASSSDLAVIKVCLQLSVVDALFIYNSPEPSLRRRDYCSDSSKALPISGSCRGYWARCSRL
jgi:hypothetical protein